MENAVALVLGLPFYVGLRSGGLNKSHVMLSPSYPLAPHPTPVSRQGQTDDVVCVQLDHGSENGQLWRYSALRRHDYWTDASARALDHCRMGVKEGVAISDLGDLGALAGLGFKVRISSSGPAYAFTAASSR